MGGIELIRVLCEFPDLNNWEAEGLVATRSDSRMRHLRREDGAWRTSQTTLAKRINDRIEMLAKVPEVS